MIAHRTKQSWIQRLSDLDRAEADTSFGRFSVTPDRGYESRRLTDISSTTEQRFFENAEIAFEGSTALFVYYEWPESTTESPDVKEERTPTLDAAFRKWYSGVFSLVDLSSPAKPRVTTSVAALSFAQRRELKRALEFATTVALKEFKPSVIEIDAVDDPDVGETYLEISIYVTGDTDTVLNAYDAYTTKLSALPIRERRLLRLIYLIEGE